MVETSGEKRKRGRPRKKPVENDTPVIQTVKRGRGRPKKTQSSFSAIEANKSANKIDPKDLKYKTANAWIIRNLTGEALCLSVKVTRPL